MTQHIFAFVGISGCGKTTFLNKLANTVKFQYLSAGSIIAEQRNFHQASRDQLRLQGVTENQSYLVQGFQRKKSKTAELIVLDGHVVVQSWGKREVIDAKVFSEMQVSAFVHLTAAPEMIVRNRMDDLTRKRPIITPMQAKSDQEFSIAVATRIADLLSLPIRIADISALESVAQFMSRITFDQTP